MTTGRLETSSCLRGGKGGNSRANRGRVEGAAAQLAGTGKMFAGQRGARERGEWRELDILGFG